jgi:hypothetical protein
MTNPGPDPGVNVMRILNGSGKTKKICLLCLPTIYIMYGNLLERFLM